MSNGTDLGQGTKKQQGGFGFEKQAKIIEQTRKINIVLTLINSKNILYFTMALENMAFLKMALPSDRANTKQNIFPILFLFRYIIILALQSMAFSIFVIDQLIPTVMLQQRSMQGLMIVQWDFFSIYKAESFGSPPIPLPAQRHNISSIPPFGSCFST